MAKGKSQCITLFCQNPVAPKSEGGREAACNRANYVLHYNPRSKEDYTSEPKKYCPKCRVRATHKRKDTKKGN